MQSQQQLQQFKKEVKKKKIEEHLAKLWGNTRLRKDARNAVIFAALFGGATAGRVAMQAVPSVEPIIPLAVLAGLLFGMKEGATLGAGAYVASNFFIWGLQGPWTIFQALGAGAAGLIGGLFGKLRQPRTRDLIILSVAGTVIFELVVNIGGVAFGIGMLGLGLMAIPAYFLMSLPFSALHAGTNAVFAKLAAPLLKLKRPDDELKIVSVSRTSNGVTTHMRVYHGKAE